MMQNVSVVPAMNIFWPQATFIAFFSILLAGIFWVTIFTVCKAIKKQSPSIFGSSDLEKRVEVLEKKQSDKQ
ncbi:MAG: hypothetical protein ABSB31_03795 [Dehalococcoidia bacterium]|jgi:hypothetical protein